MRRVLTGTNVQVPAHTPLLQLEAIEDEAAEQSRRARRASPPTAIADDTPCATRSTACAGCCSATTSPATRCGARWPTLRDGDGGAELIAGEHRLLDVFTDVRALSRARHDPERELLHSPQEYLHAFLRSLDAKAERLPERFVSLLERALAHYGVDSLDRTPALEEACYRLFVSQERADLARAAVMAILERRLNRADELVGNVGDEFRGVLDRLEFATERRDPVIADQARQLRNRYYDQPRDRSSARPRPTPSSSCTSRRCSRTRTATIAPSRSPPSSRRRSCSRRS